MSPKTHYKVLQIVPTLAYESIKRAMFTADGKVVRWLQQKELFYRHIPLWQEKLLSWIAILLLLLANQGKLYNN